MQKRHFKAVLIILLFVMSGYERVLSQEIKNIDGVRTVINKDEGKWGDDPEIKIELVRKIGSTDTEDDNYMFYLPADIAEDKEGNVYVLDSGNFTVKKYSPEGKFILNFGEWGQGPGELFDPIAIDIGPHGNIGVADAGNSRMEIYTATGRTEDSYRLDNMAVKKFFFDKDGNFVFANGINPGYSDTYDTIFNKKGQSPLLYVMGGDGQFIRGVGNVIYEKDMYLNLVKNNGYFCIDDEGNYYVTFKSLNRIQKHGPEGKIIFRAERSLNYTTEVLSKTKQRKSGRSTITDYPKMNTVSKGIAVDSKKRIWIATYNRQIKDDEKISVSVTESRNTAPVTEINGNTEVLKTDMFVMEVFSSEGVLLGKIQLGHFMDDIRIFGDRLYVLDKFRGMQFYVYKITG